MATIVNRIIDPGGSGDYLTFAAMIADLPADMDLISADEQWNVGVTAGTYNEHEIVITSSAPGQQDATRYLRIFGITPHAGVRGAGAILGPSSNMADNEDVFRVEANVGFTVVEDLAFTYSGAATNLGGSSSCCKNNGSDTVFRRILSYDAHISSRTRGISTLVGVRPTFEDCIALNIEGTSSGGGEASGIRFEVPAGSYGILRNCTSLNAGNSAASGWNFELTTGVGARIHIVNCVGLGGKTLDFKFTNNGIIASHHNLSSDATADDQSGDGHLVSQTAADVVEDMTRGAEGPRLKSTSPAIAVGMYLGPGDHATDIDGVDRTANGRLQPRWDMGAFQIGATPVTRDFIVARALARALAGETTITLIAGADYPVPVDPDRAFIRILSPQRAGTLNGASISDFSADQWAPTLTQSSISSSAVLVRASTTQAWAVAWEYVEYVGTAGGPNEFIVRHRERLTMAAAAATDDSATMSGIVNTADCWPVICAQTQTTTLDSRGDSHQHTLSIESGPVVRATRADTQQASTCDVVVVEFTGSNWTVQRISHTYSSAGASETESVSDVGNLARAFIDLQLRTNSQGLDESGQEVWLNATNQITFFLQSGATVSHVGVAWVISNSQTSGQAMVVQRSGQQTQSGGSTTPEIWTDSITPVTNLDQASLTGFGMRCSGTGDITIRTSTNARLSDASTVTLQNCDSTGSKTYRFEVMEWPAQAASLGAPIFRSPIFRSPIFRGA